MILDEESQVTTGNDTIILKRNLYFMPNFLDKSEIKWFAIKFLTEPIKT